VTYIAAVDALPAGEDGARDAGVIRDADLARVVDESHEFVRVLIEEE
jgi:hypothetical protein